MDLDEALRLLRDGPQSAAEWNRRRLFGEKIPDLGGADLRGADLRGADLREAVLRGALLQESNLVRADLSGADLTGASLPGAFLPGALFFGAHLREANLRGASLQESKLVSTDLREADLRGADLTLASLIRCNLVDAVFDEADVADCQVQEPVGRPKLPGLLRVGGRPPLTGEASSNFFNPSAIVEVCLTEVLTDEELGAFRFHLGDLRRQGVGIGVYLTGERVEASGTILSFQAGTYAEVYDILPVLLRPFRMSREVDWAKTYEALPEHDRGAALMALAKVEAEDREGRWLFATRMAEVFGSFPGARVTQLRDGRKRGIRIEVATDQTMYQKLARHGRAVQSKPAVARQQIFYIPEKTRIALEQTDMNKEVNAQGYIVGSAIGSGMIVAGRDANTFINSMDRASLDPESRRLLVTARQALESGSLTGADKDDAADDLSKLAEEVAKPKPQPGRVKRLLESIRQLAPDVASILGSKEIRSIQRHTRVEFPKTCQKDVAAELVLQLTVHAPSTNLVSKLVNVPLVADSTVAVLTVRLTAPAFQIEPSRASLTVPIDRDSEPVRFVLTPLDEGSHLIEIELYHRCDRVGYLTILSEVVSDGR